MFTDLYKQPRQKLGLHIHTTRSDGRKSPEEVLRLFKDAGYDAIALTDHWIYGAEGEFDGMTILSGCEYNVGGSFAQNGVFHIVGWGMREDPVARHPILKTESSFANPTEQANAIIDAIHEVGGIAELAHPAWSVNSPEQIRGLRGICATEIYNTVSDWGMSNRPYSGAVVDMLATGGTLLPLLAVDDCHYYNGDHCVAATMVEAPDNQPSTLYAALAAGDYYATTGPQVHLLPQKDGSFLVRTSSVSRIVFMTNRVWAPDRQIFGENLTEAVYHPIEGETFIRAEVTDKGGKMGWSNPLPIH